MTQDHIKLPFTEIDIINNELKIVYTFLAKLRANTEEFDTKMEADNAMTRLDNLATMLEIRIEEVLEGEEGK